jgi:Ty3 transposon capsid-like protein
LHEELRARDALHSLRQRGIVDDYDKAFTLLVVKVPQMTLEEQLYNFIKGLKSQVQVSVALQSPTTLEEAKKLASSADGILYQHRQYPGPTRFSPNSTSTDSTRALPGSAPTPDRPRWSWEPLTSAGSDWTWLSLTDAELRPSALNVGSRGTRPTSTPQTDP